MAIDTITPASGSLIEHGDSFSFKVDDTYLSMVIKVQTASALEKAYDSVAGGAQGGYTVSVTNSGGRDTFVVSRDAGWDISPTTVSVTENETGSFATTGFSYVLAVEGVFPQGKLPYNPIYVGTLTITDTGAEVRSDVGVIDFVGATVTDVGVGTVQVTVSGGGGAQSLDDVIVTAGGGTVDNDVTIGSGDPIIFRGGGVSFDVLTLEHTHDTTATPLAIDVLQDDNDGIRVTATDAGAEVCRIQPGRISFDNGTGTGTKIFQVTADVRVGNTSPADAIHVAGAGGTGSGGSGSVYLSGKFSSSGPFGDIHLGYDPVGAATLTDFIWSYKPLHIKESNAASADSAGYGQIWVKDDTPNTLYYTDDAGTDFPLGVSAPGKIYVDFPFIIGGNFANRYSGSAGKTKYTYQSMTSNRGTTQGVPTLPAANFLMWTAPVDCKVTNVSGWYDVAISGTQDSHFELWKWARTTGSSTQTGSELGFTGGFYHMNSPTGAGTFQRVDVAFSTSNTLSKGDSLEMITYDISAMNGYPRISLIVELEEV